jgi:hypothetical protein
MATFKLFQINDGEPKILTAFFHKEKRAFTRDEVDREVPSEVVIHGTSSTRDPVYLHLLMEDLTGANKTRVQHDLQLTVDLFAVDAHETPKRSADNRLSVELEEGLLAFTLDLALGKQELASSPTTLTGILSTSKGHRLKKEPEVVVTALGPLDTHPLHHLVIELPIEDDDLASLLEQPAYSKRVLAWCWLLSKHTKARYAEGFWGNRGAGGVDITGREARMEFLQNGSSPLRSLLPHVTGQQRMQSRSEYNEPLLPPGCRDPFVYDEPTANSVRFSKFFPFAALEMGSQLGSIGLCRNNLETYYENEFLRPHVALMDFPEQAARTMAKIHGPYGPTTESAVVLVNGKWGSKPVTPQHVDVLDRDYPFSINELQNSQEEQFLFRESSAALWTNSIEAEIVTHTSRAPQPKANVAIDPKSLGHIKNAQYGKASKLAVLTFDMLADYTGHVPSRTGIGTVTIVHDIWEQKEIDLAEYQSISIPQADLRSENGSHVMRLGKGFPFPGGAQSFLPGWLHTKVALEADPTDCRWQAHPYAHRPLILSYELERNLRAEEEKKLLEGWRSGKPEDTLAIELTFLADVPGSAASQFDMVLPFPFLDSKCGKAGKHLALLYLTSPYGGSLWATIRANGLIQNPPTNGNILGNAPDSQGGAKRQFRAVKLQMIGTPSLVTYRTLDADNRPLSGLFDGNPLVSLESMTPLETREKLVAADTRKFEYDSAAAGGKFILSFLPTWGSAAGSTWELAVKWADHLSDKSKNPSFFAKWSKSVEVGSEVVKTVLSELLKKKGIKWVDANRDWAKSANDFLFGDLKATAGYLDKLNNDLGALRNKIATEISPLKRSAEFQKSPFERDELILMCLLKKEWALAPDSKGLAASLKPPEEVLTAFFVRPVNLPTGTRTPFIYCFGPQGGLLERADPSKSCSIDEPRMEFLSLLRDYKKQIEWEQSNAPGAARRATEQTLESHLQWLTDPSHISATGFNKNLKEFFAAHAGELAAASGQRGELVGVAKIEDEEQAAALGRLLATFHLWRYLNATEIVCPACGNIMQMNWGWCPYHPADDQGTLRTIPDANQSGSWEDEFLEYLARSAGHGGLGNPRLAEYLRSAPLKDNRGRLLVHCSQFMIRK